MSRPDTAERVVVDCELEAPPEKVWRALTDRDVLARWLLPNDFRPEPGSRFALKGPDGDIAGTVLALEPPHLLSLGWRDGADDTVVTFRLAPTPAGGTHLRLVHSDAVAATRGQVVAFRKPARPAPPITASAMKWAA